MDNFSLKQKKYTLAGISIAFLILTASISIVKMAKINGEIIAISLDLSEGQEISVLGIFLAEL